MTHRIWILMAVALGCAQAGAVAENRQDRVLRLQNAVLAPCCYTEPVATHQSEIALKMRLEIARLADEGRSDDEIIGQYVRQYGARILVDPRTRPQPWSLVTPWAVLAAGTLGLMFLIHRWRRRALAVQQAAAANEGELPDVDDE